MTNPSDGGCDDKSLLVSYLYEECGDADRARAEAFFPRREHRVTDSVVVPLSPNSILSKLA